jgi:putative membrane protein
MVWTSCRNAALRFAPRGEKGSWHCTQALEVFFEMTTNSGPPAAMGKASDHLANERTFLAWIRTSISILVFGFVVAKFGVTLREFLGVQGSAQHESGMSPAIGVGFMVMGIFMALVSLLRYRTTMKQLNEHNFQPAGAIVTVLAVLAALVGVILVVYLIHTARTL